ncbi:MAG: endonuclease III [Firmicutes bacterium]|jgi:endonuclease-3|nr:endonuclease III [Bacillota bacterium]
MSFHESQVNEILDKLELQYPDADCALDHNSVFQLLVSVVLSAQTTDKSVNVVTKDLFAAYPDADSLAQARQEDVEPIIRRIGMYKTKSKNILALAKQLVEQHDGQVPEDYDALIQLPGVGRKTANVVLAVGFGHQRIAVDTHVFRVSNRIGLVEEKDVLKTELALMKTLPEERWSRSHHSLIFLGRYCCHARKPDCDNCVIGYICEKKGVE